MIVLFLKCLYPLGFSIRWVLKVDKYGRCGKIYLALHTRLNITINSNERFDVRGRILMFYDREEERKQFMAILNIEPALVYFVYGPINSGKTSLITTVLQGVSEPILPFYVNFRGRNVGSSEDFLNILFSVDRKSKFESGREYAKELLKGGADIVKKTTGIPVPMKIFDLLFQTKDKGADVFFYLEEFFTTLVEEKKLKPVFILDELQMLKNLVNSKGNLLLDNLFNFFVRLTKETHLCHCFAITSDSVFIQQIYGNARLRGRGEYILIDDLKQEHAFEVYEKLGFTEKEFIWNYLGGKVGDLFLLYSKLQQGYSVHESLDTMFRQEVNSLKLSRARLLEQDEQHCKNMLDLLFRVSKEGPIPFEPESMRREVYAWVDENVLFLDPVKGIVRPQGQLIQRAIRELEKNRR